MKILRVIIEIPVEGASETDLRFAVERLAGGGRLHRELQAYGPVKTGTTRVKRWSSVMAKERA